MEAIEKKESMTLGFSGAGGKTTTIFFIANQLIKNNKKVLITTTTKMMPMDLMDNSGIVIRETFFESDLHDKDIVQWLRYVDENGKGISPQIDEISKLHNYTNGWKLIEIDGSARKPIKAPNDTEPVYPEGLDVVYGVLGASSFGQKATKDCVHRLPQFLEVTGLTEDGIIGVQGVANLINHPRGLFKGLPVGVEPRVLITQVKMEHLEFIEALREKTSYKIEVMPWIQPL